MPKIAAKKTNGVAMTNGLTNGIGNGHTNGTSNGHISEPRPQLKGGAKF